MDKLTDKERRLIRDFEESIKDISNHSRLYEIYNSIRFDIINNEENRNINIYKLQFVKKYIEKLDLSDDDLQKIEKRFKDYDYKSYPDQNNPKFTEFISNKMEFAYNKNEFNINKNPCSQDFEKSEHQIFLKNFIHEKTPYKGLLLYHGVGTGKTCTAVTITDNFRDLYERDQKRIIILAPNKEILSGWKRNIFDVKKGVDQCTADTFINILHNYDPTFDPRTTSSEKTERIINKVIKKYYELYGYGEFAGLVDRQIKSLLPNVKGKELKEIRSIKEKECIKKFYSNRVIIIDEVHNLRSNLNDGSDESGNKKKSLEMIQKIVMYADNLRLLLLSATPMYDNSSEILWFLNILLLNDNRTTIDQKEIFLRKGGFSTQGLEILQKKSRGYISYLRGENPASFPIRLYPDINKDKNCLNPSNKSLYPNLTIYNKPNSDENKIKFLKLYKNELQGEQKDFYLQKLKGYENSKGLDLNTTMTIRQTSNILFPNFSEGNTGFDSVFDKKISQGRSSYSYKKDIKPFLVESNIQNHSMKIFNILSRIFSSEGIIFIFSEFIRCGVVPTAFALEHMGFKRFGNKNILNIKIKDKDLLHVDSDGKLRKKSELKPGEKFNQACYVLLTGDGELSKNNTEEINALRNESNVSGQIVKVILGSGKVAEGLDFKRVREIHILEPWYNLNKIEQVVGRGIRFCSHELLSKEKRNVTVYLHVGFIKEIETVDIELYKLAENKAIEIGNIEHVLKENAVDCYINNDINHIKKEDVIKIKIITSQKNNEIIQDSEYNRPYDKPYTKVCAYKSNCDINCPKEKEYTDSSTINYELLNDLSDRLIKVIQYIFGKRDVYTFNNIKGKITEYFGDKFLKGNIIYLSLEKMVRQKIPFFNQKNIKGYLILKNNFFIFQPFGEKCYDIPLYNRMIKDKTKFNKIIKDRKLTRKKKVFKGPVPEKSTSDLFVDIDIFVFIDKEYKKYEKEFDLVNKGGKLRKEIINGKNLQYVKYIIDHLEIKYKKVLYTTLFRLIVAKQLDVYQKLIYDYVIDSFIFKDGQVLKICDKNKDIPFGFYLLVRPKDNSKNYVTNASLTDNMKDFDFFEFKGNDAIPLKNTDIGKIQKYIATDVIKQFNHYKNIKKTVKFCYLSLGRKEYNFKIVANNPNGRIIGRTTSLSIKEILGFIEDINPKYIFDSIQKEFDILKYAKYLEMILKENDRFVRFDLHYFLYLQI